MKETVQLFGEFLLHNGIITSEQLLDALEFQKESLRVLSIMHLLESSLDDNERAALAERVSTGESPEAAAAELGFLSAEEIQELYRTNKAFRIPLGEVLVRNGALTQSTLDYWLKEFSSQAPATERISQFLATIELFADLSDAQREELSGAFKFKYFPAGEEIYRHGDYPDGLYVIESGLVSSSVRAGGETREADRYHSSQCFGVEGALNNQVRVESTRAVMNTVAWRLESKAFHELLEREPRLAIKAAQQISQSVTRVLSGYQNPRSLETNVYAIFVESENPEAQAVALAVVRELRAGTVGVVQAVSVCDTISEEELNATRPETDELDAAAASESDAPDFFALQAPGLADARDWKKVLRWLHAEADHVDQLLFLVDVRHHEFIELALPNCRRTASILHDVQPEYLAHCDAVRDRIYSLQRGRFVNELRSGLAATAETSAAASTFGIFALGAPTRGMGQLADAAERIARRLLGRTLSFAFGGGGARGLAHVGILQVLEQNGIYADEVAGTSVGSIVAGAYAAGLSADEIREYFVRHALETRAHPFLDLTIPLESLAAGKRLQAMLKQVFGEMRTDETLIPFFPVATDMQLGQPWIPRGAKLYDSVKASCTLPGILPLVEIDGRFLGDGGVVNNIPADVLRESGAGLVVSLNITPDLAANDFQPRTILGVLAQTIDIAVARSGEGHYRFSDLEVKPEVEGFGTADFSGGYRLIELGAEAMERKLPELRRMLRRLDHETRAPARSRG